MPLQNRVTPDGQIVATPARGTLMGNRGGMMHRIDKSLGPKRWVTKQWITCRLSYKGRWREVMGPNSYTELFFLDEATAFSAGHRPCYECRNREARFFSELWGEVTSGSERAKANAIDTALHAQRLNAEGRKATFKASVSELPTGTMVHWRDGPYLIIAGRLLRWSAEGYTAALDAPPDTVVNVLTPKSTIEVFRAGYDADLHESALEFM
ncbi:MAG: hypothetical protein ACR2OV_08480 [Hyphomicrobiaceae bacterium]